MAKSPKVLILRMRSVPAIDATGIYALERLAKKCRADGTTLILAEIREQPLRAIVRARKLESFGGRKNLAKTLDIALDRALVKLRSDFYDQVGQANGFGRADLLASFALFDDNPQRINSIEAQFRKITPALIQKTAQEYLRPSNRTVLVVEPGTQTPEASKSGN